MASVAASFVAADKSWLTATSAINPGTDDFALSLYLRPTTLGTQAIIATGANNNGNDGFYLFYDSAGSITLRINDSVQGAYTQGVFTAGLVAGQLYNIVVNFDRDGVATCYVNGVANGVTIDISGQAASLGAFVNGNIGANAANGAYCNTSLSHLRFWKDRLLSEADVARQCNMADGVPHARPYDQLSAAEKVGLVSAWDEPGYYYNQVEVTGTLSPDATGTYTAIGMYGGVPCYQRGSDAWYLWYSVQYSKYYLSRNPGEYPAIGYWRSLTGTSSDPTANMPLQPGLAATGTATVANVTASSIYPTQLDALNGWRDLHGSNDLSFAASPIISPTVNNGGFETAGGGGADVFGSWLEFTDGTSTINDETSDVYAGSHACRLDVDASNSATSVRQGRMTVGKKYAHSFYGRSASGTPLCFVGGMGNNYLYTISTSYAQYSDPGSRAATSSNFTVGRNSAASNSIYLDNITLTAAEILTAEGPLTSSTPIVVADACHLHAAASPAVFHRYHPGLVVLVVPAESRVLLVPAANRTLRVPAESHTYYVPAPTN